MTQEAVLRKLDIGPGVSPYPGCETLDFNPRTPADIQHNLNEFPYPIEDQVYDFVHTSHCIEHLEGYNAIKCLDEIWRIMKPGGTLIVRVPHYSGRLAWCSPEHFRPFSSQLFGHFDPDITQSTSPSRFRVKKCRLVWNTDESRWIYRLINALFTTLASWRPSLCERWWCYWVGGFDEVNFEVERLA